MQIPEDAILLRIFIGESDKHDHHPLYEVIVKQARASHLAGATMLRGPMLSGSLNGASGLRRSEWQDRG